MNWKIAFFLLFFLVLTIPIHAQTIPKTDSEKITDIDANIKNLIKDISTKSPHTIVVHGTEYKPNETATVWLQLLDENGNPVNQSNCLLDIYYPNKTKWYDKIPMIHINNSDGLYYFDIVLENIFGVYPLSVNCFYIVDESNYYIQTETINYGSIDSGDYLDTYNYDGNRYSLKSAKTGSAWWLDVDFVFYPISLPYNYTGTTITWIGTYDRYPSDIQIIPYDWCLSNWWNTSLPNVINTNTPNVVNYLNKDIYNTSCLFGGFPTSMMLKFNNTVYDLSIGYLKTDFLKVSLLSTDYGIVNNVKGSGELHLSASNITNVLSVGNVSYVEDAQSTFSILNYAGSTEYASNTNGSIIYQFILTDKSNPIVINDADYCNVSVWFPNNTLFINNSIMTYLNNSDGLYYLDFVVPETEGVYKTNAFCYKSIGNRNGYGSSSFHIRNIAKETWIYTDRTLTNYNQTEILSSLVNITSLIQDLNTSITNNFVNLNTTLTTYYLNLDNRLDYIEELITNITLGNVSVHVNLPEMLLSCEPEYEEAWLPTIRRLYCYLISDEYG